MAKTLILPGLLVVAMSAFAQSGYRLQPEAGAAAPESLFGTWGSPAQCAAHRAGEFDNPALYPYEISQDWIRQGLVYCYMRWRNKSDGTYGLQAMAEAQCGEDTIRDYRLVLELREETLRIHWSADFSTASLQLCQ